MEVNVNGRLQIRRKGTTFFWYMQESDEFLYKKEAPKRSFLLKYLLNVMNLWTILLFPC